MGIDPVRTRLEIFFDYLKQGKFEALIGEAEDAEFECKKTPYMLDTDLNQLELAKDVSAFANSSGGLILMGFETESESERAADVVRKVRTFRSDLFNAQRYSAVLESSIYPRIKGVVCQWHPASSSADLGVASILVPTQDDVNKPFLVNRVISDSGKIRGNLLGWYHRYHDKVGRMDAKDIHHFIRAGRVNYEVERRLAGIETLLSDSALAPVTHLGGNDQVCEQSKSRIQDAIRIAGLSDRPAYVLTAWPIAPVQIPHLFASKSSRVVKLLESPPTLRTAGFEIDAGGRAEIVEGKLMRAAYPEGNRDLELWRDGSLFFVAPADQEFLCWSRRPPPPLVINPVVLLESIYLFCELVSAIQDEMVPQDCGMVVGLELHGVAEKPLHLKGGELGNFGSRVSVAPQTRYRADEQWVSGKINAAILAYRIATKVYEWFGIAHDQIPYAVGEGEARRVDTNAIINLRG